MCVCVTKSARERESVEKAFGSNRDDKNERRTTATANGCNACDGQEVLSEPSLAERERDARVLAAVLL